MKKNLFLAMFFFSVNYYSQTFNLGFKYEPSFLYSKGIGQTKQSSGFFCGYFLAGYQINEKYQIELQPGYIFVLDRYKGLDLGLTAKYFVGNNKSYLTLGTWVNFLSPQDTHLYHGYNKTLFLGSLGAGVWINRHFILQLSFQFPVGNDEIGETTIWNTFDPRNNSYVKQHLKGIFKLGLGYSFDI